MSHEMLNAIPAFLPGVLVQAVDSSSAEGTEAVIVLPNKNQIKVVNEVGSFILRLIDHQRTVAEIVREVAGVYAAPLDQIEADVLAFLEQLSAKDIIILSPPRDA